MNTRENEFYFPYPVLGVQDSILGDEPVVTFIENIPSLKQLTIPYRWVFDIDLKNKDLLQLIEEGKAQYMCEISCSATLMRKCIFSKTPKISVEIARKEVFGVVHFSLYVVTTRPILGYTNSMAHPDYQMVGKFDLDAGAPLAILNSYKWDAELCYEDLTSLRSIIKLSVSADKSDMPVLNLEGDYIELMLPQEQYTTLRDFGRDLNLAEILHSSLFLFALQGAITEWGTHKDRRWARALSAMIEGNKEKFSDFSLSQPADSYRIAMLLLDNPIKRVIDVLPKIVSSIDTARTVVLEEEEE